jgi:hypothetical protein
MTDAKKEMDAKMQSTSLELLKVCKANGLTVHESMATMAITLAAGFRGDGLNKHQAISRFAEIISIVYKGEMK